MLQLACDGKKRIEGSLICGGGGRDEGSGVCARCHERLVR